MIEKPVYLVKFVPRYDHALTLRKGMLFMRPAIKYDDMDGKQGDTEGIIGTIPSSKGHQMSLIKGYVYPIYCMYSVFQKDIHDGIIHVSRQAIADFKCLDGYGVFVPYKEFVQRIPAVSDGFKVLSGNVSYRESIPKEINIASLSSDAPDLFKKLNDYMHQQEFRVVYLMNMFEKGHLDREKVHYLNLSSCLCDIACIIPVSEMDGVSNNLHILAE